MFEIFLTGATIRYLLKFPIFLLIAVEESLHKTKKQDHLVNSIGSMEISEELGAETSSEF